MTGSSPAGSKRRKVALLAGLICIVTPVLLAQGSENAPAPRAHAGKSGTERKQNAGANQGAQKPRPDAHPGERALDRLENMSPEERAKALANLPPQRRQELEQKLRALDALSPAERMRVRGQLERLNRLPPQRQNQVRRAIRQFQNLPEDRKAMLTRELDRMAAMSDEDRRSYMNTEEFRNRYTPTEQQMMENLAEVLPENGDNRD